MTRYDPFEEMDRMFDQFRPRTWNADRPFGTGHRFGGGFEGPALGRSDVNMDLKKREDEYVFVADLPGFETEEIDLTFEGDTLVLRAEHEVREAGTTDDGDDESDEIVVRTESHRSRRVAERVTIPADIDAEAITATYRNGVLEVHLPLLEADEDDGKKISIAD